MDDKGETVTSRRFDAGPPEESIVTNSAGVLEKTTTKRDAQGRVVEARCMDVPHNTETVMTVRYSEDCALAEVSMKQDSGAVSGFQLTFSSQPNGSEWSASIRVNGESGTQNLTHRVVIGRSDPKGNWTRKTVYSRDASAGRETVAESINRDIIYYPEA